jgi:hypothetical protein
MKIFVLFKNKKSRFGVLVGKCALEVSCETLTKNISEVFTNVKVKLLCSEVRAIARVKLSLPALPKAKLHYSKITSLTK